jgi:hypothetical protein
VAASASICFCCCCATVMLSSAIVLFQKFVEQHRVHRFTAND